MVYLERICNVLDNNLEHVSIFGQHLDTPLKGLANQILNNFLALH